MTSQPSLLSKSGLGQLTSLLEEHLSLIQKKDASVEQIISSAQTADSLREAKKKALENEKSLLLSIMEDIGEMNDFLRNIVLIENLFNSMYQPYKQQQEEARTKYASTISKYENKPKAKSTSGSFVELIFAGQTHVSSFQSWLDKIVKQCKIQKVDIKQNSGAKVKKIERSFYKAFYVYSQENGHNEMTDIIRCSLVFDNFEDLYKCFSIIELMTDDTLGGLLRVKDRFHPSTVPFGYRDLLINILCPGSKIIVEIQLHFIEFYKYKKVSHKMYKRARLFERDAGNLAYEYATKFMRPKIGTFKVYEASKDELGDIDDDHKSELKASDLTYDQLLTSWGLEAYIDKMKKEGWEDVKDWQDLEDEDLKNDMSFSKGHIKRFRRRYNEWRQQIAKESNENINDSAEKEAKPTKHDIVIEKEEKAAAIESGVRPSKLICSADIPAFHRALRNGWKYCAGRYLGGYTSIGSQGLSMSQALDKCLEIAESGGINIQYDDNDGKLWTLRRGNEPLSAHGYNEDNLCCMIRPSLPKPSPQIPESDASAFENAIREGWKYCPGKYLGGYTSIGAKGLTMTQAMQQCMQMSEASGINIQYNDNGGKLWTIRKGTEPLSAGGYDENNLVCLVKPQLPSKQIPVADRAAFKRGLRNGWKYCAGQYLGGYTSIGSMGMKMSEAMDKCLEMKEASGINIQYNDNGGQLWTLRKGKQALSANGYDENNLCCLIKPEAQ